MRPACTGGGAPAGAAALKFVHGCRVVIGGAVGSGTPRYVGRAVAALAADPDVARWNGRSLSGGGLAQEYGSTDLDGSRPGARRHLADVQDEETGADPTDRR